MSEALDEPSAHGDNAPKEGKARQPNAWRDLFQDQIARDFSEDVSGIENGEAGIILVISDANLLLEAEESGVAHIRPVEKGAQEQ
jgi:hypothetical protein